jgi:hypothetical protein
MISGEATVEERDRGAGLPSESPGSGQIRPVKRVFCNRQNSAGPLNAPITVKVTQGDPGRGAADDAAFFALAIPLYELLASGGRRVFIAIRLI